MPRINDQPLFDNAANQLAAFRAAHRQYKGRFVQIFLAFKFYQNELPSMFSGQYVNTAILQSLLDDLYAKQSRALDDCVFVLFQNQYHPRTGIAGRFGGAQNTWRNNFNLQKGVGCYAPSNDLASQTFLDQPRSECKYLIKGEGGGLRNGRCSLCLTDAEYRNEDHRKWIKVSPQGGEYAVVDLMNQENFKPYIAPEGIRIPLLPLIVALYHDALPGLKTARHEVEVLDFLSDFNFSESELAAYFDASPENPYNKALLDAQPNIHLQDLTSRQAPNRTTTPALRRERAVRPIPVPDLAGTPARPPTVNSGWEAEQYVALALAEAGWDTYDVSRQKLGYDLLIKRGRQTRYVDVKSSMGLCSPTLTSREWQQAAAHGAQYVLAMVENFNPLGENRIHWVPNPVGGCAVRESTQIMYAISRSSWRRAEVAMESI